MILLCGVGGLGLAVMLVLGPLVVVAAYTPLEIPRGWLWVAAGIASVAFWLGLCVAAIREDAELRRWVAGQ